MKSFNFLFSLVLMLTFSCGDERLRPNNPLKQSSVIITPTVIGQKSVKIESEDWVTEHELYVISKASKLDFENAKRHNSSQFVADTGNSKKQHEILYIKENDDWRPMKFFRDTLLKDPYYDGTQHREYSYLGCYRVINKYVISGEFYEFGEDYLLDKSTGELDTTWTFPVLSPNNKLLVSASMPYGLEGLPNGVQILKISNTNQIIPYFEINQKSWSVNETAWESSNSLIIKMALIEKILETQGELEKKDYRFLRLTLK